MEYMSIFSLKIRLPNGINKHILSKHNNILKTDVNFTIIIINGSHDVSEHDLAEC